MALPTAAECEAHARQFLAAKADAQESVHRFNYQFYSANGVDADITQQELLLADGFAAVAADLRA